MSPGHQGQAIAMVEGLRDVLTKGVPSSARGDTPASTVIWIGPQQVTHWTLEKDISHHHIFAKKYVVGASYHR